MPAISLEASYALTALKKALRREKQAPSDQPVSSATNRGNKLKRGARYVHAGSLPYHIGFGQYREKIDHAGYTRPILDRNPHRYNEIGEEIPDSESDEGVDTRADEENPYGYIRLEELLRPLTHPSELEHHPTLSLPYLDTALLDMVQSTEEKLRQERANLWRAKNLHRHFIGDESWIPCEKVETPQDWDLFEPNVRGTVKSDAADDGKRDGDVEMIENGVDEYDHAGTADDDHPMMDDNQAPTTRDTGEDTVQPQPEGGANHLDADNRPPHNNEDVTSQNGKLDTNGIHDSLENLDNKDMPGESAVDAKPNADVQNTSNGTVEDSNNAPTHQDLDPEPAEDEPEAETTSPPQRRITRALAATNDSTRNSHTPPLSPTTSTISSISTSLLQPSPLFLLPSSLSTAHSTHAPSSLPLYIAHSGLPLDEILETRKLLGMYIQKQEETIRGLESVLGKLIKAKRMKEKIWEWCKTEGHVGEWSDGEDWVDAESWGVGAGELRKGRDEEEAAAQAAAAAQAIEDEGGVQVVGGRKGKRRRGGAAGAGTASAGGAGGGTGKE